MKNIKQEKLSCVDFGGAPLNYFSAGFANKLYIFYSHGEKYVFRKNFDSSFNLKKVYNYFGLFKKFFVPSITVLPRAIIYPYISGDIFEPKNMTLEAEKKAFNKIGAIYKEIHTVKYCDFLYKGKVFNSWVDLFKYKISEIKNFDNKKYTNKLIAIWKKEFKKYKPDKCLLHGDFSPKNILVNKDRITIIDWDKFIIGDKYFELTAFLSKMFVRSRGNFENSLIINSFFETYGIREYYSLTKKDRLYLIYSIYFLIEMYNRCLKYHSPIRAQQYKNRLEYLVNKLDTI